MTIAALPGELGDLVRRFKKGYTVERTGGGHYRVRDPQGQLVQYQGKNLTLSGTGRANAQARMETALKRTNVLRGERPDARKQPTPEAHEARVTALRRTVAVRQRNRQDVANALRERLEHVLRNVGSLQLPGMVSDLGEVASYLTRQNGRMPLLPDRMKSSAHRVVHGAWVEPRYQEAWNALAERLEQSEDVIDEWFTLIREARGLDRDTVKVKPATEGEWPFTVELLSLAALIVDHDYQRPPIWTFIRKKAAEWDDSLVGTIDVAERRTGAVYAILDGQLRFEAAKLVGKTTIWCSVYAGLDKASEARFFLKKNRDRKAIHPFYTFRARVTAGDSDAREIERIVSGAGYKLSIGAANERQPDNIAAVAAVERVGERRRPDGSNPLEATLRLLRAATYGRSFGQSSVLIQGLGYLFASHDPSVLDEGRLTEIVAKLGPDLILGRARDLARNSGGNAHYGVARVLTVEYNRGLGRENALPQPTHTSRG